MVHIDPNITQKMNCICIQLECANYWNKKKISNKNVWMEKQSQMNSEMNISIEYKRKNIANMKKNSL